MESTLSGVMAPRYGGIVFALKGPRVWAFSLTSGSFPGGLIYIFIVLWILHGALVALGGKIITSVPLSQFSLFWLMMW